jgi:hypothetical protein
MKSVLVLGCARSGTSMTAGMLNTLGVDFYETKKLEKHVEQNPKGTFENVNFITVTSKMHQDYVSGKTMNYVKDRHQQRMHELIKKHEKDLWGFKSAVTHHFLPIILPLLKNPHIVVVVRSLLHNAQSWQVHMRDVFGKNVSLEEALKNISNSQNALMRNALAAGCPKLYTSYEHIRKDPWKEAERMADFIGINPSPKKQEILDFVLPNHTTIAP